MKSHKKITLIAALFSAASSLSALTLTGTASTDASAFASAGNGSFVIVDTGAGRDFDENSLGVNLAVGASIGDDYVVAYNPVVAGFGPSFPPSVSGNANFNIGDGGTDNGDSFYILTFNFVTGSDYVTKEGDEFSVIKGNDWNLGSNNAAVLAYDTDFQQFTSLERTGTVVPEPSTYAALSGLLALAYVMLGRRKA